MELIINKILMLHLHKSSNCWNYIPLTRQEMCLRWLQDPRHLRHQITQVINILCYMRNQWIVSNSNNCRWYVFLVRLYVKPLFATPFHWFKCFALYFPKFPLINTTKEKHQRKTFDFIVIVVLFRRSWYKPQIILWLWTCHCFWRWFLWFPFSCKHRFRNVQDTQPCHFPTKFIPPPWLKLKCPKLQYLQSIQISNCFYSQALSFEIKL